MDQSLGSKGTAFALCLVMIVGSLMMFMMFEGWNALNPDPRSESHFYQFDGTLYDENCTGTGVIEFVPEGGEYRLYEMNVNIESSDQSKQLQFGILFEKDDLPLRISHEYIGIETIDGVETTAWSYSESGMTYTIYVGEFCEILRIDLYSDNFEFRGILSQ